ncbi:MAG TPA: tetratricopeptide repeat protein [Oculatellaceae cyanobacterium]
MRNKNMRSHVVVVVFLLLAGAFAPCLADEDDGIKMSDMNDSKGRQKLIDFSTAQISVTPTDYRPYVIRGTLYAYEHKFAEAKADAKKAEGLKPDDSNTKSLLGLIAVLEGQYSDAIALYSAAIKLQPEKADLYNNRGLAYNRLGKWPEAQQDASQVIRLQPDESSGYEALAEVMYRYGRYADCVKYCNEALRRDSSDADAYYYRGLAYERAGNKNQGSLDKAKAVKLGYTGRVELKAPKY